MERITSTNIIIIMLLSSEGGEWLRGEGKWKRGNDKAKGIMNKEQHILILDIQGRYGR
jgi:hypothetical protein